MREIEFGDAFEFIRNGLSVKQDRHAGGLPITRIETIWNSEIDVDRVGFAGIRAGEKEQWLLAKDDILFSHINSLSHLGKCALYEGTPKQLIHGMNLLGMRCSQDAFPKFMVHLMRSSPFRNKLLKVVNQSVNQVSVSIGNLKQLKIPLPPLAEQKRLAAILDQADTLRRVRHESLARLDELARSLFLELFGDPVTNPKVWDLVRLGQIGELDRGQSKHRPRDAPELYGNDYPFIQTGDVASSGGYIRKFKRAYSEVGLKQSKLWPTGTLCITIAANIAKTGMLTFDACFPDSIVGFKPTMCEVEYVRAWFGFVQSRLEAMAPESAQKNINLKILRDLEIPLPPLTLQQQFAEQIAELEAIKTRAQASLLELDALFASLQSRAFAGELSA